MRAIISLLLVALCVSPGRPFRLTGKKFRLGRSFGADPTLGSITLVGAGPGDPELLTVAAARALSNANALVVADRLVSKEVLELVAGELKVANKFPGCAEDAQQEIYTWCTEAVRSGRDVIRLKIGDPFMFGRGSEEVLEFRSRLGVEAAVVPGVSAVFSAPLLGGIPVTHRGVANQLVVSTGYGRELSTPALQRYHPDQTAVFLMAVGRLPELCARLQVRLCSPAAPPSMDRCRRAAFLIPGLHAGSTVPGRGRLPAGLPRGRHRAGLPPGPAGRGGHRGDPPLGGGGARRRSARDHRLWGRG